MKERADASPSRGGLGGVLVDGVGRVRGGIRRWGGLGRVLEDEGGGISR